MSALLDLAIAPEARPYMDAFAARPATGERASATLRQPIRFTGKSARGFQIGPGLVFDREVDNGAHRRSLERLT
ncbi:MAG: hypothetical protein JO197_05075, partial [Acidobacteria bacterium]|nr:hypothetical protein [Acidobacteriota bacterium]